MKSKKTYSMQKIKLLYTKEILEILRDKKTLFMMLVVPLLLYPILLLGITFVMNMVMSGQIEKIYSVAYLNVDDTVIAQIQDIYDSREWDYSMRIVDAKDPQKDLEEKVIDAFISQEEKDGRVKLNVHYFSSVTASSTISRQINEMLDVLREQKRNQILEQSGLFIEEIENPIYVEKIDNTTAEESMGMNISGILPFMIIVSVIMGAFYPAIDVTSGEKERGTLETLLTMPVTSFEMISAKFLAVTTITVITVFLSMISVAGSFGVMMNVFLSEMDMNISFFHVGLIPAICIFLLVVIVFCLFTAAVCMCTCLFAKSFKEANNYATPIMLIFMFASYTSMIPDFNLNSQTAMLPIINVVLMMKQILMQQTDYALYGIVFCTNVGYSLIMIWVLSKMFRSEEILFSDGFRNFRLFEKRGNIEKNTMPGIGDCIFLLCITLLLFIYAGSFAVVKLGFGGVVIEQLIILIMPILYLWYLKNDGKELLLLRIPSIKHSVGGLFLWLGGYLLILLLSIGLSTLFPESSASTEQAFQLLMDKPLIISILVIALMPAIGEELLFRGFVLGTIRKSYSVVMAIVVSSLVFGAFHMSLVKLLPTAILGAIFGYIGYKSGSIYIGMGLHFLNNLLSVLLMKLPEDVAARFTLLSGQNVSTMECVVVFVIGCILFMIGFWILTMKKRKGNA